MKYKTADAYVQGKSHIKKDIPCQDRTYSLNRKNMSIISLSDGAGSRKHSDIGATILTKEISNLLYKNFNRLYDADPILVQKYIVYSLVRLLEKKSLKMDINIKELASTLLFVAVKGEKFIAGHIGDGVIGYVKNEEALVLSKPENGEFSNVTYFLNKKTWQKLKLFKGKLEGISGFILMSDGPESSLYNKSNNSLSKINKTMIKWLDNYSQKQVKKALKENIAEFLTKRTIDDCSINLLNISKAEKIIAVKKNGNNPIKKNLTKNKGIIFKKIRGN